MARQRFIWPSIWEDLDVASLSRDERLLFIGLFSLADDQGRIEADPRYLKGNIFRYDEDLTVEQVRAMRDRIATVLHRSVQLYTVDGRDYIQLKRWRRYQRPQYPKPSNLPPPPDEDSTQIRGSLHESSVTPPRAVEEGSSSSPRELAPGMGRDGMDRDGMGRDGLGGGVGEPSSPAPSEPEAHPVEATQEAGRPSQQPAQAEEPEAILATADPEERAILDELRTVPRYPFRLPEDLDYIRTLRQDFPTVDLLAEVKRWRVWLRDNPPKKRWNPRLRLRNWCEVAVRRARDRPARDAPVRRPAFLAHPEAFPEWGGEHREAGTG